MMRVKRAREGEVAVQIVQMCRFDRAVAPLIANSYRRYGFTEYHVIQPRCLSESIGGSGNGSNIGTSPPRRD